jgi:hypothetical protein
MDVLGCRDQRMQLLVAGHGEGAHRLDDHPVVIVEVAGPLTLSRRLGFRPLRRLLIIRALVRRSNV